MYIFKRRKQSVHLSESRSNHNFHSFFMNFCYLNTTPIASVYLFAQWQKERETRFYCVCVYAQQQPDRGKEKDEKEIIPRLFLCINISILLKLGRFNCFYFCLLRLSLLLFLNSRSQLRMYKIIEFCVYAWILFPILFFINRDHIDLTTDFCDEQGFHENQITLSTDIWNTIILRFNVR